MTELTSRLFFGVAAIIIIFTLADYFGHTYLEKNYNLSKVPSYYYSHKIYFGVPILLIAILLIDYFNSLTEYPRIFMLTAVTVLLLQFRYIYIYSPKFNYTVIIMHYIILVPIIYYFQEKQYI